MLSLSDKRWGSLSGGYRILYDPRPLFAKLEAKQDTGNIWHELWGNLYHQGDVGDASYAAVPYLIEAYRKAEKLDWNIYALVSAIELARSEPKNPALPDFLKDGYLHSIHELAQIGLTEIGKTRDADIVRGILCLLAIERGITTHAKFLLNYSDEELLDLESRALQAD